MTFHNNISSRVTICAKFLDNQIYVFWLTIFKCKALIFLLTLLSDNAQKSCKLYLLTLLNSRCYLLVYPLRVKTLSICCCCVSIIQRKFIRRRYILCHAVASIFIISLTGCGIALKEVPQPQHEQPCPLLPQNWRVPHNAERSLYPHYRAAQNEQVLAN